MWKRPWKYREGTTISLFILIIGVLMQILIGPVEWSVFMWPVNIIVLMVMLAVLGLFYAMRRKAKLFRFMTQVEAAVPALSIASLLTVIMGLTRQTPEGHPGADSLGISRMISSWPFVLIYLWNTIIVGEVAIHQVTHFRMRHLPSLTCHVGLFVFIICGVLGSADMQHVKMYCEKGITERNGIDEYQRIKELPLAIELRKFTIEEYSPRLIIFNSKTGTPLPEHQPQELLIDKDFKSGHLMGWTVTVEKYLENSIPDNTHQTTERTLIKRPNSHTTDQFVTYNGKGAATAVLVTVRKGNTIRKGWLSTGSFLFPMVSLTLDDSTKMIMPARDSQRYASDVNIYTMSGEINKAHIEVNKPYSWRNWKIYLIDFDHKQGKWSSLNVFELVNDPWLPATYTGIFLLLAGSVLIFVNAGRNKYHKEEKE